MKKVLFIITSMYVIYKMVEAYKTAVKEDEVERSMGYPAIDYVGENHLRPRFLK